MQFRWPEKRGFDLVEVAPNAVPPVCRIMDYGKFRYEQSKKEREARKHQKQVELKEVRLKAQDRRSRH
jgi:translation initiation factor IF-3